MISPLVIKIIKHLPNSETFFERIDPEKDPTLFDEWYFNNILLPEVRRHLDYAGRLSKISLEELNHNEKVFLRYLKEQYSPETDCWSTVYPRVSANLQRQYDALHENIIGLLHND